MQSGRHNQPGFAYLMLLAALAIVALVASASISLGGSMSRRAAEEELLAIGAEYERALKSYRSSSPIGQPQRPRSLGELLLDPRFPSTRRHLRKIYADPMTGEDRWGIVRDSRGAILQIFSTSDETPLNQFVLRKPEAFNKATKYSGWKFGPAEGE